MFGIVRHRAHTPTSLIRSVVRCPLLLSLRLMSQGRMALMMIPRRHRCRPLRGGREVYGSLIVDLYRDRMAFGECQDRQVDGLLRKLLHRIDIRALGRRIYHLARLHHSLNTTHHLLDYYHSSTHMVPVFYSQLHERFFPSMTIIFLDFLS
jgi:hypothetical protein